jgi:hypothetical protein
MTGAWRGGLIVPVTVEKASDLCVWINGCRTAKRNKYRNYHPTWQEAKDALLVEAEARVNDIRRQLEQANGHLGNVKGLKEPQSP